MIYFAKSLLLHNSCFTQIWERFVRDLSEKKTVFFLTGAFFRSDVPKHTIDTKWLRKLVQTFIFVLRSGVSSFWEQVRFLLFLTWIFVRRNLFQAVFPRSRCWTTSRVMPMWWWVATPVTSSWCESVLFKEVLFFCQCTFKWCQVIVSAVTGALPCLNPSKPRYDVPPPPN